jgi:hypothetical protein
MYSTYITEYIIVWHVWGFSCYHPATINHFHTNLVRHDTVDTQRVLNAETNEGSTMRYSPISKDGMLSSRTHLEDPPQRPTPSRAAIGLHALGKDQSRLKSISHGLFSSFTYVRECERRGSTRGRRQR